MTSQIKISGEDVLQYEVDSCANLKPTEIIIYKYSDSDNLCIEHNKTGFSLPRKEVIKLLQFLIDEDE